MSAEAMSDAAAAFDALLQTPDDEPLPAEQELHATIRRYAEQGGDLDATTEYGETLASQACSRGLTPTVRLLADLRADVHKPDNGGLRPLLVWLALFQASRSRYRNRPTDELALRALAQSMARELGPKNIHVAHTIIDGAIDSNFIRENLPNVDELRTEDRLLNPDHIAANYVMLHRQPRDAWTHELDLRPWKETW